MTELHGDLGRAAAARVAAALAAAETVPGPHTLPPPASGEGPMELPSPLRGMGIIDPHAARHRVEGRPVADVTVDAPPGLPPSLAPRPAPEPGDRAFTDAARRVVDASSAPPEVPVVLGGSGLVAALADKAARPPAETPPDWEAKIRQLAHKINESGVVVSKFNPDHNDPEFRGQWLNPKGDIMTLHVDRYNQVVATRKYGAEARNNPRIEALAEAASEKEQAVSDMMHIVGSSDFRNYLQTLRLPSDKTLPVDTLIFFPEGIVFVIEIDHGVLDGGRRPLRVLLGYPCTPKEVDNILRNCQAYPEFMREAFMASTFGEAYRSNTEADTSKTLKDGRPAVPLRSTGGLAVIDLTGLDPRTGREIQHSYTVRDSLGRNPRKVREPLIQALRRDGTGYDEKGKYDNGRVGRREAGIVEAIEQYGLVGLIKQPYTRPY